MITSREFYVPCQESSFLILWFISLIKKKHIKVVVYVLSFYSFFHLKRKRGWLNFALYLEKQHLAKTEWSMYFDTQNSNLNIMIRCAVIYEMQHLCWEMSSKTTLSLRRCSCKHPVTPFMRKQTEDDPYAHTPALWQWSSYPSQYCRPSFQHPRFPI